MRHTNSRGYKTSWFSQFAKGIAYLSGHPLAFGVAALTIVVWAAVGPRFGYSNTWQLVINTGTTIITFLMVFLIQNTQNRESQAVQIKLDEIIRAMKGAHTVLLDLEHLSDQEIARVQELYRELAKKAREEIRKGFEDTGAPHVFLDMEKAEDGPAKGPAAAAQPPQT